MHLSTLSSDKVSPNFASGYNELKLPWQTFSNLIIVCSYDNEPTILNIDTACNKLKCNKLRSRFFVVQDKISFFKLKFGFFLVN
jgi:hypothetical protein